MIYSVVVDLPADEIDRAFDYIGYNIEVGSTVLVEFGKRKVAGFVIAQSDESTFKGKLKPIIKVLDNAIEPEMIALLHYMRKNYNLRYADILRLFVPPLFRKGKKAEKVNTFVRAVPNVDLQAEIAKLSQRAEKQRETLLYLLENVTALSTALNSKFGSSAVSALIKKGVLEKYEVAQRREPYYIKEERKKLVLTDEQQKTVDEIMSGKDVFLLHGVTGSGKTEVYQSVIEKMLELGKTAILLVPEISLTPQILKLFKSRFSQDVAILHSGLSSGERHDEWQRLKNGKAKIAIGARSAVFAPLKNIGVIIIDEEHDQSYISESNPRYDTRDIALFRASYNNAPLVLGSATPDIESYQKALSGKYKLLELTKRFAKYQKKDIELVDMGNEFRSGNSSALSYALLDALKETTQRGEQAILFLNRRGFSSYLICKQCGYMPKCEECTVNLSYHKAVNKLKCHYCGKNYTVPNICPECKSKHIKLGRTGTEQVVAQLKEKLPDVTISRMDFDTTSTKGAHSRILEDFAKGKSQVLVGTQMIAKGHDFANVTLVGILDMDFSLFLDDFRASERTFQLATQVAGRAGRAEKEGRVILQTFVPSHYVFKLAKKYDYEGFYHKEINTRAVTKFPPYTVIVRVLFSSAEYNLAFEETKKAYLKIKEFAKNRSDFVYLNAMKSPLNKIKGKNRFQILARVYHDKQDEVMAEFFSVANKKRKDVSCFVEINPQNLR